jgi:maltooligosyltrehalose trehalohydrolase
MNISGQLPVTSTQSPRRPAPPSASSRIGSWRTASGDVRWRIWAPERKNLAVILFAADGKTEAGRVALQKGPDGFFTGTLPNAPKQVLYKIRIDGEGPFPDMWSRSQPFGVHGPSEVVEEKFSWSDQKWKGRPLEEMVIYELHVGTATPEGTYEALRQKLPELKQLGINTLELLPLASVPGSRNWGYDGVEFFAPQNAYGTREDLKRLIDDAHREGLAVIIDVVYNHLGPDGNYLSHYSPSYFTDRRRSTWGEGINYDGEGMQPVREFALQNAEMWVRDFHADGLRRRLAS